MSRHPTEPLSPEERELASRLARLAPKSEPSAALDAAILAAARAALSVAPAPHASTRRGGRWRTWSGVSGGLITGAGMAAALVVTVGVVWQLRPQPSLLPSQGEQPTEQSVVLDTDSVQRQRPPNPPPLPDEAPSSDAAATAVAPAQSPSPTLARKPASPAVAPTPAPQFHDEPLPLPAYQAHAGVAAERARSQREVTAGSAAASASAEHQAMVASPAPPAPENATDRAPSPAENAKASAADAMHTQAAPTLDSIQVIDAPRLIGMPIKTDAQLPQVEWLQRVRARREIGDMAGAHASLALFVRTHPRVRIPDDLRAMQRTKP